MFFRHFRGDGQRALIPSGSPSVNFSLESAQIHSAQRPQGSSNAFIRPLRREQNCQLGSRRPEF
ncbi:hypothetical protein VFPPC_17811 [Pochonia chlamydosporia 170]|uniref:Uncharacterized protein n=1 Tax=Pochonia chlamydosporia 170 TaxID=1380566 RepID=A0A219AQC7_METCM|nr:hypothetical protein VFPPC_17811 [Pochonia chlamydosporia 170]OWT42996.1 hypothetical protein VFPPC_17811 [Pochonia chlamydosporia 170]